MTTEPREKRDLIAQWAFDTKPLLGRFHLWLEDLEVEWLRGQPSAEFTSEVSFLDGRHERLFAMTAAVTALGTRLFGGFAQGADLDKAGLNQVKKEADAISAYAMSESLWYLSRQLPENHAIMVCLGEGLMPKAGETPEMGANPQLGFGRVYARPQIASWLDQRVVRLLNDPSYGWDAFYDELKRSRITVWGAAIDTLENTSRFAQGAPTGPMTILHLFDQPLHVARPYEGYMGHLILPREVTDRAAREAILVDFRTPRALVHRAIELTYPGIRPEHVHVWTLRGPSRAARIGRLWAEWEAMGAHLIEDGWELPTGLAAFTDSGTYAPTFAAGAWEDADGATHVLLVDGYAASAEAMQAASLAPMLGLDASLAIFTSRFLLPHDRERDVMQLDAAAPDFAARLAEVIGRGVDVDVHAAEVEDYRRMIREGTEAALPVARPVITADDFFPEKRWSVLAACGYMMPDPYTGAAGVEDLGGRRYRVTTRLSGPRGDKRIVLTLRLMETFEQSWLVFNPLLSRFLGGEDHRKRPVKISDSGRIRNELQTLCSDAIEFPGGSRIRLHFDRISPDVIPLSDQERLREILDWYATRHAMWFSWLELGGRRD